MSWTTVPPAFWRSAPGRGADTITSHLIPAATGIPFHANLVRVATGEAPHMTPTRSLYAGGRSILATESGVFHGFEGLNDVLGLGGIEHFIMEKEIGADVVLPPEEALSSWLGSVIARAPDYDEVLELMLTAERLSRPRIAS